MHRNNHGMGLGSTLVPSVPFSHPVASGHMSLASAGWLWGPGTLFVWEIIREPRLILRCSRTEDSIEQDLSYLSSVLVHVSKQALGVGAAMIHGPFCPLYTSTHYS